MIGVFSAPSYATSPLGRRHNPPKRSCDDYRDCLRIDFSFTCAYCLATEWEVGPSDNYGGFEIEHFKPRQFRSKINHYPNLLWACHACNRAKGEVWPSPAEMALNMRFVDPSAEALGAHLELRGDIAEAVAGSPAGGYMIDELDLNSQLHRERRRLRAQALMNFAKLEAIYDVLKQALTTCADPTTAKELLDSAEAELEKLRARVFARRAPWDEPVDCLCTLGQPPPQRRATTRRERKELRAKLARQAKLAAKQSKP